MDETFDTSEIVDTHIIGLIRKVIPLKLFLAVVFSSSADICTHVVQILNR